MHCAIPATIWICVIMLSSAIALKYVEDDLSLFWRRSNSDPCEPFTTFKLLCNRCICSADSTLFCTRMYCGKMEENQNKLSEEEFLE